MKKDLIPTHLTLTYRNQEIVNGCGLRGRLLQSSRPQTNHGALKSLHWGNSFATQHKGLKMSSSGSSLRLLASIGP